MSKHFQLTDFLLRAPKDLLQLYCARRRILDGFDWKSYKHGEPEKIATALRAEVADVRHRTEADFRMFWDHQGASFNRGILNEAQYHNDDAAYQLLKKQSSIGKAIWATLERPAWAANAKILSDVDKLPPGAWIKRANLPVRPEDVDEAVVARLEDGLIEFFTRTEHRGHNCKINCLRRGDEEVFFAYAEDHPESDLMWQGSRLLPQILKGSFKLIFKHDNKRRTLDIHFEGDRSVVPDLQQTFSRCVIGDEIDREADGDDEIYELEQVRQPGFEFRHSADLGIVDVRVKMMRFVVAGEPWRRFTAEASTIKKRDALDAFVADLTASLPKSRLVLDQVCISVLFEKRPEDRRALSRMFYITAPNSIRLQKDDLGEKIVTMLVQSGIERSVDHSNNDTPTPQGT